MSDTARVPKNLNLHLAEFFRLAEQCSPELQKDIYSTCCAVLQPPKGNVLDHLPQPDDDVLTAAHKVKEAEGKKVGDLIGWNGTKRKDFENALIRLAPSNVSLDFIVTSLVKMLDDSFRFHAETDVEERLRHLESMIPFFESKKAEDSPENATRWDQLINITREQIDAFPEAIAERKRVYDEWRRVFGGRADMPTFWGRWHDLVHETTKDVPEHLL